MGHEIGLLGISVIENPFSLRDEQAEMPRFGDPTMSINPRGVAFALLAIMAALILMSLGVSIADHLAGYDSKVVDKLSKVVSVDKELNVPAFFSMLLLLLASTLLWVIAMIKHTQAAKHRWYWAILALGFLYMAFDEIGEVHEKLIEPMRGALGNQGLGIFYFAWVVPAIVLVCFLALVFIRFWWELPGRTRFLFMIAGMLFLGGAVGVEMLDGKYAEIYGKHQLIYQLMSATEEALEMSGVIVFIYALLDYLSHHYKRFEFRLSSGTQT